MIPHDWQILELGEVAEFSNGKAHENLIDEDGAFIVVNSKFISSEGQSFKRSRENLSPLKANEIAMVMSDIPNGKALGKCFLVPEDNTFALNQRICSLRPRKADSRFLFYFLNRNRYFLEFDNGVGQTNLRKDEVLECPVYVPPLNEQRKIAEILSCWDDAIKKYEQLIDRTAFSFRRLIKEFLGDGRTKNAGLIDVAVEDCCDILDTKRKPLNKEQRKDDQGEIPYYGANGKVGAVDDWIFDEPLILIAEDGGYFDEYKTRPIAYRIDGKSWVNNHAHVLKAKSQFDQNCIFFCLVHKDISTFLNGGTRAKLNRKELEKIVIQLPSSLEKQQLVGSTLDSICTEINLLGSILEKTRQEKLALMQKLLTGKIRVKV